MKNTLKRLGLLVTVVIAAIALFSLASCEDPSNGRGDKEGETTFTVRFDRNGGRGTVPGPITVSAGSSITLPDGDGLSKSGYVFGGWNTEADGEGTYYDEGESFTPTGNVTLYAQWDEAYTVSFDANGGSGTVPPSQKVKAGSSITLPNGSGLTRTGYTFGGWNTNESGTRTNYNAGGSYTVTGDITLYAQWTYTVTFSANGGSGTAPAAQTVEEVDIFSLPYITLPGGSGLTRTGYAFGGWNTNESGTGTNYSAGALYTVTGSITLYARWYIPIPVEMVHVPGGSFQMGNPDTSIAYSDIERPVHTVTLSAFSIGKYEVTQAQWNAVMGSHPSYYGAGDNYPVYGVNWYDALVFCNKLSTAEGLTPAYRISSSTDPTAWGSVPTSRDAGSPWNAAEIVSGSTGYRLPTEAQWEYAAKGGNGSPGNYTYAGSNNVDEVAWYRGKSGPGTHEVGTKAPNGLGIYDMSGNVMEWCWDWYNVYLSILATDPMGASSGSNRVLRGGCWDNSAERARSAHRYYFNPSDRYPDIGFRLARPE